MNEIRPIVQDYRRIVQDWTGLFLVLITRKHCEGLLSLRALFKQLTQTEAICVPQGDTKSTTRGTQ